MNIDDVKKTKVLIIGTVPYKQSGTSRALDSFFHNWKNECLIQFFSDSATPFKGHCSSLFQITDVELLKARLNRKETGTIFYRDSLKEEGSTPLLVDRAKKDNWFVSLCFRIGKLRTPVTHLLRGLVWRKKYWCSKRFLEWADSFSPQCVFISFSDDFFILQIGLFFAERYGIPIVCQVDDDYFFDSHFSLNPFYYLYRAKYKKLVKEVFSNDVRCAYISDKIKEKYNSFFGIDGEAIYLSSDISRKPFTPVDVEKPKITYFGNVSLNRYRSLLDIADALLCLNKDYRLEIYTSENNKRILNRLRNHPGIVLNGKIPYGDVKRKMLESDITIVVESFRKKNIRQTRYSLSTKAADVITSGTNVLTYGPKGCGVIDYFEQNNLSTVCFAKKDLKDSINNLIMNIDVQKKYYEKTKNICRKNHMSTVSTLKFENMIKELFEAVYEKKQ